MAREQDFQRIKECLSEAAFASSREVMVAQGDSLEMLARIPSNSVSLILTDPPYHSTKKDNIFGDTHFETDDEYIVWMLKFIREWRRVLRPNGSLLCFCASEMAARIEVACLDGFNVLSRIVWTKPNEPGFDGWKQKMNKSALRQWYAHSERIVFAEPAAPGNLFRSHFGHVLREARKQSGLSMNQLTAMTGDHGKVNHGGAVSNWEAGRNTPSREQYARLCEAILSTGKVCALPPYEDVIRPFTMDGSKEFTDVWTFPSVRPYKGKHPAEKPLSLLEHAIEATTFPGDIVLDCFAGSGSTADAAQRLGRRAVAIEIEPHLADRIAVRLKLKVAAQSETLPLSFDQVAGDEVAIHDLGHPGDGLDDAGVLDDDVTMVMPPPQVVRTMFEDADTQLVNVKQVQLRHGKIWHDAPLGLLDLAEEALR